MMNETEKTPLILGGGLSGLSAAYHGNGIIYEKAPHYGGACQSPIVNSYTFDMGIHVLHTTNTYVLNLLADLGVELFQQPRDAWIYSFEQLTRYPFQANTFGLPIPIVKECLEAFVENYCQRKNQSIAHACSNYEQWINAAFGKGIAEHFMIPYSEKFWTIPPREMTTEWLEVRIPMPNLGEVIEGALTDQKKGFGPNILFKYPSQHGISALPKAFAESGLDIRLNKEAVKIDLKNRIVFFHDGDSCAYSSLISTIPLPELFQLFAAPSEIQKAVDALQYNSILCVNIGVDREVLNEKHWIYYLDKKYPFFRISFLKNFASYMAPRHKSSITAEVAYSRKKPIDKNTIATSVIEGLIEANILDQNDHLDVVDLQDLKYGYVIFDHSREDNLAKIISYLQQQGIVVAGRYGSWEYQWMDDAILDGKRAAEEVQISTGATTSD